MVTSPAANGSRSGVGGTGTLVVSIRLHAAGGSSAPEIAAPRAGGCGLSPP